MEDFAPYEDLIPPIVLRAQGKVYTLPVTDWEKGVDLHRRIAAGTMSEDAVIQELLGDELVRTLIADGVPGEFIDHVGAVAFADWKFGRETAKQVWADPKAVMEKIAETMRSLIPAVTASTIPTPASATSTKRKPRKAPSGPKS